MVVAHPPPVFLHAASLSLILLIHDDIGPGFSFGAEGLGCPGDSHTCATQASLELSSWVQWSPAERGAPVLGVLSRCTGVLCSVHSCIGLGFSVHFLS